MHYVFFFPLTFPPFFLVSATIHACPLMVAILLHLSTTSKSSTISSSACKIVSRLSRILVHAFDLHILKSFYRRDNGGLLVLCVCKLYFDFFFNHALFIPFCFFHLFFSCALISFEFVLNTKCLPRRHNICIP